MFVWPVLSTISTLYVTEKFMVITWSLSLFHKVNIITPTAQKVKFSITDFFSKYDQIRSFLCGSLMENFIFCAV